MLDVLVPDSEQGRVYRALTLRGRSDHRMLSQYLGLPETTVHDVLNSLAELGLVYRVCGEPDRWEAAPPDRVMALALAEEENRRARLWQAGAELDRLYHQARTTCGPYRYVEPVEHPATLLRLTARLQERARQQVRWLDRPPYYSKPHHFRAQEDMQTRRMADGVRYRTVYSQAVYDDQELFATMTRLAERGERVRVLAELPVKLTIGDADLGLLVPDPDRAGLNEALLVHASALLQAFIGVFETLWTLGVPVTDVGGEHDLPEPDRAILTLMAAGVTDDTIARRLDMSRRTVVRRIASLLDRLGATTRFQAGVQAAKRGLL
ncbi:predicted transcriptional regulator [Saccharomonospora viridis DSM 43017]|uniref:Predicted transcriptional regulator n=1 Tax=Saccharomonospora viridis (strain ATCC 15386 / DSM 43017 / JCM 3036 / CCUG 5913 / NBRC 12207 / NCIMB 9602 / P101) TaxID=471857 RepID=C7MZN4_SACVD|nr:predicted transcriptional regulator [Saccharomonospora viridis DSM 43017]